MTDDPTHDMTDDPDLTPEQERDVRRMLADARHAEPMPGDVAARLDRVLAELAAGEHAEPSPVADLAAHRRRRVATLLVAAAAVVAVGVGIGQVLPLGSGSDSQSSADSAAGRNAPEAAGSAKSQRDGGDSDGPGVANALPEAVSGSAPAYALRRPSKVSERDFPSDVRRVRSRALREPAALDTQDHSNGAAAGQSPLDSTLRDFVCTPADWGAGIFVPVVYAGDPGVLVFRRATGDTQVADLFQCGSSVVLRSITLPAP